MTLLSNTFITAPSTADTVAGNDGVRSISQSQSSISSSSSSSPVPFNDGPTPSQVLAMTIKKKRKVLRRKDHDLRVELLLTSTIRRLCQEIGDRLRVRRVASAKRRSSSFGFDDDCDDNNDNAATVRKHAVKRNRFIKAEFSSGGDDELFGRNQEEEEVGPVEGCDELSEPSSSPAASCGSLAMDDQNTEDHSTNRSWSRADDGSGDQLRRRRKRKANDQSDDSIDSKRISNSDDVSSPSNGEDSFNEKDPFGLDEFFRSLRTCRVGGSKS